MTSTIPPDRPSSQPSDHGSSGNSRHVTARAIRTGGSLGLAAVLLLMVVPRLTGDSWRGVVTVLIAIPHRQVLALAALWFGGLLAHSTTLAAAMPALGRRRALMLSLTGSSVSNVLPFGGPAGVALNYRMSRSWGFAPQQIGRYTVVTNVFDVLVRLSLPAIAVVLLAWSRGSGAVRLMGPLVGATAGLLVVGLLAGLVLVNATCARRFAAAVDGAAGRYAAAIRRPRRRPGTAMLATLAESAALVRSAWPRLSFGVVVYAGSLALLLASCLRVVDAGVTVPAVLAGLALERVMTMVPITPGGIGVVEAGVCGIIIALGGDPVSTVTGVILYRFFTYAIEIPVGGVALGCWLWAERSRRSREPAVAS